MSESFGPYTLLEKLAEGGIGEVFLARRSGGELVVLKKLRSVLKEHPTAQPRLVREAHVVSSLSHPNIARLLDAGFVDDTFYLTSELVRGRTLATIIRSQRASGGAPGEIAVSIACSVLDALDHAHGSKDAEGRSLELVHRDVSAGNVMVDRDGVVKLIDFGVAYARVDRLETAPGVIIGTPTYMAPEQVLGRPIDERTDLYAVGALLYEALNGVPVTPSGPVVEVLQAIVQALPAPFRAQASDQLQRVVFRALEKDPYDRWSTAAEFREALLATPEGKKRRSSRELSRWLAERFPEDADRGPTIIRSAPDESLATRTEVSPLAEPTPLPAGTTVLRAVVLLALSVVVLASVVALTKEPSQPQPIEPPIAPLGTQRPSVTARDEPPPAPLRAASRPPAKVIREPAKAPPATVVEPKPDRFRLMLMELERKPNHALFVRLSQALDAAADALPPEPKRELEHHLDRANLTMDVSALRSAIEVLDSFNRAPR